MKQFVVWLTRGYGRTFPENADFRVFDAPPILEVRCDVSAPPSPVIYERFESFPLYNVERFGIEDDNE